ncbi:MAG: HEAT repeat domain-containing protein [bacterium]
MRKLLLQVFKIYEGEGYKVFLFALAGALLHAGISIGSVASDALFLTRLGAERLSYIYFVLPGIMIAVAAPLSYLTGKWGAHRIQFLSFFALLGGGAVITLTLALISSPSSHADWLYFGIKLYACLWSILGFTVFWNYVDAYFDILSAKRLFPVLGGATTFGAMAGGWLVMVFMDYGWNVNALFVIGGITALPACIPVAAACRSLPPSRGYDEEELSFSHQMLQLAQTYRQSRYVIFLTLSTFLIMIVMNFCEFQYMRIFNQRTISDTALAALFGRLFLVVNVFNTVFTLFVFNRMIFTLGVRNTSLIQPVAYLVSFAAYVFLGGYPGPMYNAAIFGFFVLQGIHAAMEDNNWNFMLNPVPQRVRPPVRAFLEGVVDPLGGAAAGFFLILMNQHWQWSHTQVSLFGTGLSGLLLIAVLGKRHYYMNTLIENLRAEWLDFSTADQEIFPELENEGREALAAISQGDNLDDARLACWILWKVDRLRAAPYILDLLERCPLESRPPVLDLVSGILAERDSEITRLVIAWMMDHPAAVSSAMIQQLGPHRLVHDAAASLLMQSPDPNERGAASTVLWHSWDIDNNARAMAATRTLLEGNPEERKAGIRTLATTGQCHYAHYLIPFIQEDDPEVRRTAKWAICRLADEASSRDLGTVLEFAREEDPEIRGLALQALSRIGDSQSIAPLLGMADAFSPHEQRRVYQVIMDIGLRSIPAIAGVVRDPHYPYAGRRIAARAIARLAFPQLLSAIPTIIQQEIRRAYQILCFHSVLANVNFPSHGIRVLSRYYRDEQQATLEFILEILALGGQIPSHEMIASSLRSNNPKIRGDAIETLEQAVSRPTFRALLPLVDGRPTEDKIRFYFKRFRAGKLSASQVVDLAWSSQDELERAAAAQTLWDLTGAPPHALGDDDPLSRPKPEVLNRITAGLDGAPPLLKNLLFSILFREAGRDVPDTLIERIALLGENGLFSGIGTRELAVLAGGITLVSYPAGAYIYMEGDPVDAVYWIREGEVLLRSPARVETRSAGQNFGEELLFGTPRRLQDASADPMTGYRLDRETFQHNAQTYSRIAIALWEHAMQHPGIRKAHDG